MNVRLAYQRMELLLYANFSPQDLFLTLTYSDDRLPQSYAESQKRIKAFVRRYRAAMLARGRPCPYLYVIEGQHGDKRVHHHLVCEQPLGLEELQTLWGEGHCFIERIRDFRYLGKRGIPAIALYITKEPRKTGRAAVGRRMWTPSLGLNQPERIDFELPPGQPFTLPEGAEFPFAVGDCVFVPDIRQAVAAGQETIHATVIRTDGTTAPLALKLCGLTEEEKQIILAGCLMNWYAAHAKK